MYTTTDVKAGYQPYHGIRSSLLTALRLVIPEYRLYTDLIGMGIV